MLVIACNRGGPEIDATGLGVSCQRIDQMAVFNHMGERLAGFDMAGEGQEDRPGRVFELGIGNHHIEDRLGIVRDLAPYADRLEQPPARRNDGGRARVATWPRGERGIGHNDRNVAAETLPQCQRQRQPCKCAAADDNASLCRHGDPCSRRETLLATGL